MCTLTSPIAEGAQQFAWGECTQNEKPLLTLSGLYPVFEERSE
jgi:hypothetical protein